VSEPRIYLDRELRDGEAVTIDGEPFHHLIAVLRRIRGDTVVLFNGRGGECAVVLETVGRKSLTARVTAFRDVTRESPLDVTLAQAVSKGERMDYTVQKAVELGVTAIQPLVTDHVVVQLSAERWQRKCEHWQGVAVAACEQSGRTRVPVVAPVVDLRDWLNTAPAGALKLVLVPEGGQSAGSLKLGRQPMLLLVGPEGGLSEQEMRLIDLGGFTALSLGPRVLRTETAGMVALAVMQSLWGDLGAGSPQGK
jgi:16S rRNA (uracil1498-N3)-methyltransferase